MTLVTRRVKGRPCCTTKLFFLYWLPSVSRSVQSLAFAYRVWPVARQLTVLVNRDAQGVTNERLRELHRIAGPGVYVSESLDDARAAVRAILDDDYQALGIGGGDGTFMQVVLRGNVQPVRTNGDEATELAR